MEADHRQERSNHMKRKLLLLSVLAICVATLAAGTLAYFSANGTARNVITTGNVSIAVEEWADADKTQPFEDLTGIMPGTTVTKIAEVRNTGEADAWIRVRLTGDIRLTGDGTPDPSLIKPDLNTTDWTLAADGYLYCNKAIRPGETTAPLFTCVTFDAGMGNEYQDAEAYIDWIFYAKQYTSPDDGGGDRHRRAQLDRRDPDRRGRRVRRDSTVQMAV